MPTLDMTGLGKAPSSGPGGSAPGVSEKPRPPSRSRKQTPKAKALPMSKESQIRALREGQT